MAVDTAALEAIPFISYLQFLDKYQKELETLINIWLSWWLLWTFLERDQGVVWLNKSKELVYTLQQKHLTLSSIIKCLIGLLKVFVWFSIKVWGWSKLHFPFCVWEDDLLVNTSISSVGSHEVSASQEDSVADVFCLWGCSEYARHKH